MATTYTLTFRATYNANGGSGAPGATSNSITNNRGVGVVTIRLSNTRPTRTNYTFLRWQDGSGNTYNPGQSVSHTFDDSTNYTYADVNEAYASYTLALSAVWSYTPPTGPWTVSYKKGTYGSGTNTTDSKIKDVPLTLKGAIFTRSNYNQTGWSTVAAGTSKAYNLGGTYTNNAAITLYPYWSQITTYTISYKKGANGTGTNTSDTKTKDVPLTLKGAIFTRSGYTQTGWSTSDGGSKVYDLNGSYTANAAATLYPYWSQNYTITYKPGANGAGSQITITKYSGIAIPILGHTFARAGYYQTGWSTSDGGSKAYDFAQTYSSNANLTLYPYWEPRIVTYVVTNHNNTNILIGYEPNIVGENSTINPYKILITS